MPAGIQAANAASSIEQRLESLERGHGEFITADPYSEDEGTNEYAQWETSLSTQWIRSLTNPNSVLSFSLELKRSRSSRPGSRHDCEVPD